MATTSMMSSQQPYLLRALHEWIVDNDLTPHLVVDATLVGVVVPLQYVQDGQIVLNISPGAVVGLQVSNEAVSFSARFGGVAQEVYVPMQAVLAIYAKENQQGMAFDSSELPVSLPTDSNSRHDNPEPEPELDPEPPRTRPSLKIVK